MLALMFMIQAMARQGVRAAKATTYHVEGGV